VREFLVNKINRKDPIGRLRTQWMEVVVQDINDIKEDSIFDDAYDRERMRGFKMAVMTLNRLTN